MRGGLLSCRLLDHVLPVRLPLVIDPVQSQGEHGLGLIDSPPRAGAFQALLDDVTMRTLDLAGADWQSLLTRPLIIELVATVAEIARRGAHWGVGVGDRIGFHMKR